MAFDPDAFLLEEDEEETIPQQPTQTLPSAGFDPDAFLAEEETSFTQPATAQPAYQYDPSGFRRKKPVVTEPKPEEQGILRQVADIPLGIARGGVTGIKMMTDILGADNPVSQSLSGVEGYMADLMSAQAKEDQQEISRIMKDAEDKGFGEQVKAGIKAFSIAPVDIMSQALGTMAPVIATGLAGSAAKLGALGMRAVQAGVGAGMGAGMIKGEIYNEVKNELVNSGIAEDAAEKAAVEAQAYGGKNLDQILLGAGLGAASTLGAEGIITRILTKQGTAPAAGVVSRVLKGGLTEAAPEAAQAAQEQLAKNVALQREGFDVDPSRGVVAAATMEAVAAAPLGGIAGAVERPAPIKTLAEENLEQTNEISRKVAENGAPLTASALQDQAAANLRQDELAKQLEAQLEEEFVAVKKPTAAPPAIQSKEEFAAIYSQVAPEELDAAEAGFTQQAATAATEEGRANAQNALEAIKEVKATVTPPAPPVEPAITPAVQPAVPTAQLPITDATQEIIQPEGVREEPQDRVEGQPPEEAGVSDRILGAARGEEEGQVVPTPTAEAIKPEEIKEVLGGFAKGAVGNLYDMLFGKLQTGDTTELGQPSRVLAEAMPAYQAGIIKDANDLRNWVQGDPRIREAFEKTKAVPTAEEPLAVPPAPAIPEAITRAIEERRPISAPFVLQYGVDLPRGWRYEDDFFVPPAEPAPAAEVPAVTPTPAAEVAAPEPIISEIPATSELVGEQPVQPTIREVPEISPIVGAEPAAIVEQEPVAPAEEALAITPTTVAEASTVTEAPAAPEVKQVQTKDDFRKRFLAEEVTVTKDDPRFSKSTVKRFGLGQANVIEQKNLSEIVDSPSVFHETNLQSIRNIVSRIKQGPRSVDLWASNSLDLALGQGGKGYVIELDTQSVNGSVAKSLASNIMSGIGAKETEIKVNKTLPQSIKSIIAPSNAGVNALRKTAGFEKLFDFDNATKTERGIRIPVKQKPAAAAAPTPSPAPVTTPPVTEAVTPAEAPAITPAPVAETPAVTPVTEVAPTIEPLTDDQAETIRDVITLRKSQGREPNPEQVKRLAEYDARKAGVDVQEGDIVSNIVVGHPMFEAPQPELSNLVPIKVQNKEQLASPIQRTQQVRDAAQSYIGQYQVEQSKAKTPAQKKAFAKKFNKSELDRQRDILDYIKNDVMPELDRLEKSAPSATPAVSETITAPTPAPTEIAVGAAQDITRQPQVPILDPIGYGNALIDLFPSLKSAGVKAISMEESLEILNQQWEEKQKSGEATVLDQLVYLANKKNTESALAGGSIGGTWTRSDLTVAVSSNATPSAMAHEIGHAIMELEFSNADQKTKDAITSEYNKWFASKYGKDGVPTVADQRRIWEWMNDSDWLDPNAPIPQEERVANWERYRSSFKEWFADEVAKWATTNAKPRSLVEKFFTELADKLNKLWNAISQNFSPNETLATWLDSITKISPSKKSKPTTPEAAPTGIAIGNRIRIGKSPQGYVVEEVIPQTAREKELGEQYYKVRNEKTGKVQTVEKGDAKPIKGAKRKMTEKVDPLPEGERYGKVKLARRIQSYFDGKIPDRIYVVDDGVDPEYEYKAAYYPEDGILIINNAFIRKNENIGDIIAHELGHYAFGDQKFKSAFDEFYTSLAPDEKAEIDKMIEDAYSEETGETQLEEKQVIAFTSYAIANPQRRNLWNAVLDALKSFVNRVFGKNFKMSDPTRTALAVLATAKKRFAAGEEIVREETTAKRAAAQSKDARFAELEKLAKAGDKEAEAEAQRMVDEAAKKAGYDITAYHGTRASKEDFDNIMRPSRIGALGPAIYLSPSKEGPEIYAGLDKKSGFIIEAYVKGKNLFQISHVNKSPEEYFQYFDPSGKLTDEQVQQKAIDAGYDGVYAIAGGIDNAGEIAVFKPEQVKSAEPFTYDDAGNLIPLSERFQATSPDIRKMAARKVQVGGAEREESKVITTPEGILSQNTDVIRQKFFDSRDVSPENTTKAWGYISRLLDIKSGNANELAGEINDVVEADLLAKNQEAIVSGTQSAEDYEKRIGAAMFTVELMNYAGKLAADGDARMLKFLNRNINDMPVDKYAGGVSDYARGLRTRREYDVDGYNAYKAEQSGKIDRTAATLFGTGKPSQEQVNAVDDAIRTSDKVEIGNPIEVAAEIEKVEKRTGRKVLKKIEEKIRISRADKQAQAVIDQIAKIQSDTPSFTKRQENEVKSIVQQDLKQNPDMGRKESWTSQLTAKLTNAGVSESRAERISNLVWKQHENKALEADIQAGKSAAEEGSLKTIIQKIKDTPLEMQQEKGWREQVIREYLMSSGLDSKAAETAAKLYDSVISERLAEAKQKAFEDTLKKAAPWKDYLARNSRMAKDALEKIKVAIRTGVLDPDQTTESVIAKENGWTGFTKDQFTRIVQLDSVIHSKDSDDVTKREAMADLNKIISDAKLPVRFKDALGSYYVGNALMGIPTLTVNISSPIGFSVRNLMTDIGAYAFTDPSRIPMAFETFLDSMRSWYDQTSYAFRNQIYLNDVVEYLQGQNVLRELFDKGKRQWANGEYAKGFVNMAVGMTQITGRVLSSLDQGAIAMLENQNITRYAMEALSKANIPKDKRKEFANMILDTRRRTISEAISNGMQKDRAGVLADMAVKSEIISALSEYGINPISVLDSSVNDALQSVGRNKTITVKGLEKERKDLSDAGVLSYLPISFLEQVAQGASSRGPAMQIFSKMLYGFALVPARVFHNVAWYSPYGFLRLAVDKYKKNQGQDSPYAMSLQTEAQYKQRLTDAIAGSIVMLGLAALRAGSSDEEDDKKGFRIVITGNGPSATTDRQYFDSWNKKWKPYSIHIVMGDSIIPINIGRGGEALFFPIMLAGAMDDWEIKKKQNDTKKEPEDLSAIASMLGSSFFALAQRGPYAAFTKPLFDASKDGRVTEELASQAGYFGKTFIPVIGSSLARNISDLFSNPIDRSSIEGAIYANTPVVGPWLGTKALNALGQPIRADDWGDKLFKLGVPVVFSFPKDTPMNELNELILKQGSGPTIPTRTNAQKRFGDILTDKEFEAYVTEYGKVMSDRMFKNRSKLARMKPADYDDELEKYARGYSAGDFKIKGASDLAVQAVKKMRQ